MAFFECEFPRSIGFVSTGGDMFSTQVNTGFSGVEQRNKNWSKSKRKFLIPLNGKEFAYFDLLRSFFLNVGGKADAFRFYWPLDSVAADTPMAGVVDGANKVFQLQKTYTVGSRTYTAKITKPIMATVEAYDGTFLTDTVVVKDNGVTKTKTTDYTVDATTGLVSFVTAPAAGHTVSAACQFHIPVRFDTDTMEDVQILSQDLKVKWPNVALVEDRRP
jgi:uncharacterized protein (TIGR02217 family)